MRATVAGQQTAIAVGVPERRRLGRGKRAVESDFDASHEALLMKSVDAYLDVEKPRLEISSLAWAFTGGAAGNRTRVLRHSLEASPCAVRYASTRIS